MADGGAAPAFLGVSRSLSGRVWRQRPADAGLIRAHMQALDLDEPLARALAARGVRADQGADFLTPTLKAPPRPLRRLRRRLLRRRPRPRRR